MTAPQNVLPIHLQELILEYQDEPEELVAKFHLILEHLKSTGKENLEGFQYLSRATDIVINQLGKPGIAGNEIVGLNTSNKPLVDHESPSSSEATSGHLQEGHDSTTGDKSNQNDDLYALSRVLDAKSSIMEIQQSKEAETQEMDESELRLAQLQHQLPSNETDALMHLVEDASNEDEDDLETKECKSLFKDVKIFLSREVSRESLPFVIPAFGGVVSWEGEGAPFNESDQSITHQIVDHPTQGNRFLSRQYVQPQWIYDCVNSRIILPVEEYLVGRVPPPHLSPFVDNEAEGYIPEYAETIQRLKPAATKQVLPMPGVGPEDLDDLENMLLESRISKTKAIEAEERKKKMAKLEKQYHDDLKKETKGVFNLDKQTPPEATEPEEEEAQPDSQQVKKDEANLNTVGMSRRKRRLYEAMQERHDLATGDKSIQNDGKRMINSKRKRTDSSSASEAQSGINK